MQHIYHKGWSAVTKHKTPWVMVGGEMPAFDDDVWELYDGSKDYSQARNLASEQPERLAELQRLWLIEAVKYNVVPLDDRSAEQGGRFGGWTVYFKDGQARFVYNTLGIHEYPTAADTAISAGTHQVRMEFAYDGGGLAKGGDVTLFYDGTAIGTGRVETTHPMIFSADETDIGQETGTTVTPDYTARDSRFTGKINWVQLDVGTDDHDHFIEPEERLRIAMARQ